MRVSKNFLNDYVKVDDLDFHELAEKMVFCGNEYESIERLSDATGLVIGEVVECVDHPESDHLHICQVNTGKETKQIICGAPNVRAGLKVIVAEVGAVLPGNITIKKAKLAGLESNGMICSLEELGLDSKYLRPEDKEGIHELPLDAPVGEDAIHYLGYDDEVIDFELTADRADLMSMLGMAYEVGAIYDRKVTYPETEVETISEDVSEVHTLSVETKDCPIYLGRMVRNVQIKESPMWLKNRLMASGIRSINNVVDISNYVMLEYGQPLHFFDSDALGRDVIVRNAKEMEEMTTLDGNKRILGPDDLVIANKNEAVCLAGVMGGLNTEVEEDTKNIFIEAAIFDALKIRNTARHILRSEASSRYEKGIDPNRTRMAIDRACYLLNKYADGEVLSGCLVHDTTSKDDKKISITLEKINQVLGMSIPKDKVEESLLRLGFTFEGNDPYVVSIPTRRLDVNIKEDLISEIGKIYGYHKVIGKLPVVEEKPGTYLPMSKMIKNTRKYMNGVGLNQVITYSLTSLDLVDKYVMNKGDNIVLLDPLSEERRVLRKSMIQSLIDVYDYHHSRHMDDLQIFECGKAYYQIEDEMIEENLVTGLLSGTYLSTSWKQDAMVSDFYLVKGIVEGFLNYLGLNRRYQFRTNDLNKDLHPGRSCSVYVDNECVGYLGQVHPKNHKKELYVFELSLDKLLSKKVRMVKYKEISKYPVVHKDVAFVVNIDTPSEELMNVIKKTGGRLLTEVTVFDVYRGENVANDEKSIAYALTFQDQNRTLEDKEVTEVFHKIIENVEKKCNAKLRDK